MKVKEILETDVPDDQKQLQGLKFLRGRISLLFNDIGFLAINDRIHRYCRARGSEEPGKDGKKLRHPLLLMSVDCFSKLEE